MKSIFFICCLCLSSQVLAKKKGCLKRSDLREIYDGQTQFISNYGHVLVVKKDEFETNQGYHMDAFAMTKVAIKNKKTKQFSHYLKCLKQVEEDVIGSYVYGSFSATGVKIRSNHKIKRVSFIAD